MPAKKKLFHWIILYLYILFAWNYYHIVTHFPGWVDEIVFKPFVELVPVLYVVFAIEKNNWQSLGFTQNNFLKNIQTGVVAGILLIVMRFMMKNLLGSTVSINPHHLSFFDFGLFAITSGVVGFLEETMFRGYFFQRLWWISRSEIAANIITSCMFALSHMVFVVYILHYSLGELFFYAGQIVVMGMVFAFLLARSKSVIPSLFAHMIWKFSNAVFI